MDPNQNTTQQNANPAPQAVPPPVQSPQSVPAASQPPSNKNNKIVLYVITVLVLVLIGGLIFILFGNKNSSDQPAATELPTIEATPTQGVISEETEVDNIVIDDPTSDFVDVDKDLQGL